MYDNIESYFKELLNLPKNDKFSKWDHVFKSMSVHTRKRIPTELLLAIRPNEEPHIFNYRLANYRAITYGSMNKALDDLHRIVSGISYSINAPDNVKEYINNHIIGQYANSIHNEIINTKSFIHKITLKRDIEDPNGFLIWFPSGAGITDSSQKVIPEPKLILSDQHVYSDDFVFIYKACEKYQLSDGDGKMVLSGDIYYFITKQEIWIMYQTGTLADPKWEQELIYAHNFDEFPIIVLGGDMNSEGYYDSYFSPYLAFGDQAVHQFSDWQAIMTTSGFPQKEVFANECLVREVDKTSNNPSNQEENYKGGGNGQVNLIPVHTGAYNIILRKTPIKNNVMDDALDPLIPSIRYINPDINVAKYSGESWEKLIEMAEKALNIDMNVGVNQSGVAKQIDKESQYSMITKIGNNFFDNIYTNSLKIIDGYMNRITLAKSECSINKPTTFWVKNELDLIQEISSLKTSNSPSFFLAEATIDLAKKRFSGNPVNEKIFKFISLYDPYFIYTQAEKSNMLASGVLTAEEYIKSLRMFSILNQMVEEITSTKFIEMGFTDINDKFEEMVSEFLPVDATIQYDANGNPV